MTPEQREGYRWAVEDALWARDERLIRRVRWALRVSWLLMVAALASTAVWWVPPFLRVAGF